MAEYIERAKLRKTLKKEMQILKETPGKDDWDKGLMQGIKESIMHLNVAPAVDVVEVVRCGECKFYSPVEGDIGDCEREDILYLNVNKSDFCSYGVRKKDKHV